MLLGHRTAVVIRCTSQNFGRVWERCRDCECHCACAPLGANLNDNLNHNRERRPGSDSAVVGASPRAYNVGLLSLIVFQKLEATL